jgi:hypothetical protein
MEIHNLEATRERKRQIPRRPETSERDFGKSEAVDLRFLSTRWSRVKYVDSHFPVTSVDAQSGPSSGTAEVSCNVCEEGYAEALMMLPPPDGIAVPRWVCEDPKEDGCIFRTARKKKEVGMKCITSTVVTRSRGQSNQCEVVRDRRQDQPPPWWGAPV